jgi:hypothetical protein
LPTRIVGFSERDGSWNTIEKLDPRCARNCLSPRPSSSAPSKRIEPDTLADGGRRPMTARELTVLPEPDSPMIASVRPAATV